MAIQRHGISIGIERTGSKFFLSMKVIGKLTHEDYEIITPMIDSALAEVREPKAIVFIDCTEFNGWDAHAAWDDFKLGLKHRNEFKKIALYGNREWQEMAAKIGSWFISGEVKFFEDEAGALSWLTSSRSAEVFS